MPTTLPLAPKQIARGIGGIPDIILAIVSPPMPLVPFTNPHLIY